MQSIRSSSTRLLLQRNRLSITNTLLPFTASWSGNDVSRSFDSFHSTRAFDSPAKTYLLISSLTKALSSSSALPKMRIIRPISFGSKGLCRGRGTRLVLFIDFLDVLVTVKQNFTYSSRCFSTVGGSVPQGFPVVSAPDAPPRIKFKRLDKTAKHIMQIVDKEAVEEVRTRREIPEIRPGYIVQLKVEVPENKRRVSIVKGIVIARRNAGLNSTFRIRRLVAGVGVESMFPLYSPNLREIKVLDKKRVRRAKLYYLRDKMNALKKH
ncbi:hypothetical protein Bca101_024264 [Brassica carinata]